MNLMINNYCNFKCSYCFAQETMHSKNATNVTMENFCIYLDWLKQAGEPHVRLIGGEPTMHPQLEALIDKVIEYDYFKDILIFSNFSFKPEVTEMLISKSQKIQLRFLPNINNFNLLLPTQRERILYNLDMLTAAIPDFRNLGVNIYSPDMDLTQWEDLICKYDISDLRFSIVLPNEKLPEDFDFYTFFHSYQDLLLQMAELSVKYGVHLNCDCNGLPICCFDDDAVITLMKVCPEIFGRPYCDTPSLDLTVDLYANGCFVCGTDAPRHITEFKNLHELQSFYREEREGRFSGVPRKECYTCKRYEKNGAPCSCWSYRKDI